MIFLSNNSCSADQYAFYEKSSMTKVYGRINDSLEKAQEIILEAAIDIVPSDCPTSTKDKIKTLLNSVEKVFEKVKAASPSEEDENSAYETNNGENKGSLGNDKPDGEKQAEEVDTKVNFRGKENSKKLSYLILSYFQRNVGTNVSLSDIDEAVKSYFGSSNKSSINMKLNRYKDDEILAWQHPDRRSITQRGIVELKNLTGDIDEATRKEIENNL